MTSRHSRFWINLAALSGLAMGGLGCGAVQNTQPYARSHDGSMPEVQNFTLDNGMYVIVIPDHRAPVVTHMIWYRVGAADEPSGQSGVAHFLEHLMFKGTEKTPQWEFSKTVARQGGQDNAFTGQDFTAYFQLIARDRLPLVMDLEADRMTNINPTERDVTTERDVVLEERRGQLTDRPLTLLGAKMQAALYGDHPYGIPVIGFTEETAALTRDDVLSFYEIFYAPNNAALVIAGDVTVDEVRALAMRYYGPIPAHKGIPLRERGDIAELSKPVHIVHRDRRVKQPSLQRIYLADSYNSAGLPQATAIDMLVDILGGGTTARLYQALVVDKELAVDAGAWSVTEVEDRGRIGFYATPREGISLERLETALDEEINRLRTEGVRQEEVERAQRRIVAQQVYARDNQQDRAHTYGIAWATGTSPEEMMRWPEVARTITADKVTEAARRYFNPQQAVTGWLMPEDERGGR
ncbi:MAG: pitrilysin family protein [Parvularculales bacterium]